MTPRRQTAGRRPRHGLPGMRAGVVAALLALATPASAARGGLVLRHPWPHAQAALQALGRQYARETGAPVSVLCRPNVPPDSPAPREHDLIGLPTRYANIATISRLARAGRAQDLGAWMDGRWRSRFGSLAMRPFLIHRANHWGAPPGIYGVPLSLHVELLLYRPDVLARAGVTGDPAHWGWDDLLAAGKRLRAAGIEPVVGALQPPDHPALAQMYEPSYVGASGLCRTYHCGSRYLSPAWRAVCRVYVDLRRAGICCSPLAFAGRAGAEKAFLEGHAAILVDGPWFAGVQAGHAPELNGWKVAAPPWGGRGARFMPAVPGGVGESVLLNPRGRRHRESARFLRWLTDTEPQVAFANATWMLPAASSAARHRGLHPGLRLFAQHLDDASPDLAVYEDPEVNRIHYEGVAAILKGKATPEAVLARVDRAKARRQRAAP